MSTSAFRSLSRAQAKTRSQARVVRSQTSVRCQRGVLSARNARVQPQRRRIHTLKQQSLRSVKQCRVTQRVSSRVQRPVASVPRRLQHDEAGRLQVHHMRAFQPTRPDTEWDAKENLLRVQGDLWFAVRVNSPNYQAVGKNHEKVSLTDAVKNVNNPVVFGAPEHERISPIWEKCLKERKCTHEQAAKILDALKATFSPAAGFDVYINKHFTPELVFDALVKIDGIINTVDVINDASKAVGPIQFDISKARLSDDVKNDIETVEHSFKDSKGKAFYVRTIGRQLADAQEFWRACHLHHNLQAAVSSGEAKDADIQAILDNTDHPYKEDLEYGVPHNAVVAARFNPIVLAFEAGQMKRDVDGNSHYVTSGSKYSDAIDELSMRVGLRGFDMKEEDRNLDFHPAFEIDTASTLKRHDFMRRFVFWGTVFMSGLTVFAAEWGHYKAGIPRFYRDWF